MGTTAPLAPPLPSGERSARPCAPGEGEWVHRDIGAPSPHPSPRRGEGADRARPRQLRWSLGVIGFTFLFIIVAAAAWIVSLGRAPIGEGLEFSTLVVD